LDTFYKKVESRNEATRAFLADEENKKDLYKEFATVAPLTPATFKDSIDFYTNEEKKKMFIGGPKVKNDPSDMKSDRIYMMTAKGYT